MSNIKQCYFVFQRQTKKWQYQEADTNLDQDQPKYLVLRPCNLTWNTYLQNLNTYETIKQMVYSMEHPPDIKQH